MVFLAAVVAFITPVPTVVAAFVIVSMLEWSRVRGNVRYGWRIGTEVVEEGSWLVKEQNVIREH